MSRSDQKFNQALAIKSAVRLFDDEPNRKQQGWFVRQCETDQQFQQQVEDTCEMLADLQPLENDSEVLEWLDEFESSDVERKPQRRWFKPAIAATALIASAIMLLPWLTPSTSDDSNLARHITRVGEQKTVDLADGSRITLNTSTQILVDVSEQQRRIILEYGEAFFEVAQNPSAPFSVIVGEEAITVLGTSFCVRKSPETFTLSVTEGLVALHKSREPVNAAAPMIAEHTSPTPASQQRVGAGWQLQYNANHQTLTASKSVDSNRIASWRRNILHFANEPLSEVVYELNRYSAKKILINEATLMDKPINASLRVDRITSALSGLEKSYRLKVVHHVDHIVISNVE